MLKSKAARVLPTESIAVGDVMRPGVVTCLPDDGVPSVAAAMVTRGIHAVVVFPIDLSEPPIVTDLELARAALERPDGRALDMAREPVPVVSADAPLSEAVAVMTDHGAAHVMIAGEDGTPAGIVSSFDVVALLGGHEPRYARMLRPGPARPSPSASSLSAARVGDVMHRGVATCGAEVPLRTVAQSMAEYRVHCIVIAGLDRGGSSKSWGLVGDMDLVAAAGRGLLDEPASAIAVTSPITIEAADSLELATSHMIEHDTSHVVVCDDAGVPSGIVSTLDVASILAAAAVR
jgi:CBS domain-containing protein